MKYYAIIKISLLAGVLLLAAACGRLDFNGKTEIPVMPVENPINTENDMTDNSSPSEVVRRAYEKMSALGSYRMRHEIMGPTGAALTSEMEFVAPDRIHGIQTNTGIETILIGRDFYIKTLGSAWEKSDFLKSESNDQAEGNEIFKEFLNKISKDLDVKAIGSDTVDNIPVKVYEYSYRPATNDTEATKIKLSIGKRDNLIYQIEREYGLKFDDQPNKIKGVMKIYDIGADIKIEPPL